MKAGTASHRFELFAFMLIHPPFFKRALLQHYEAIRDLNELFQ